MFYQLSGHPLAQSMNAYDEPPRDFHILLKRLFCEEIKLNAVFDTKMFLFTLSIVFNTPNLGATFFSHSPSAFPIYCPQICLCHTRGEGSYLFRGRGSPKHHTCQLGKSAHFRPASTASLQMPKGLGFISAEMQNGNLDIRLPLCYISYEELGFDVSSSYASHSSCEKNCQAGN